MTTIDGGFRESVRRNPDCVALRYRRDEQWEEVSYSGMNTMVEQIAHGLADIGARNDTKVAIMSENRPEWTIAYLAIISIGAIGVPIDAQLGEEETRHIINHSESETLICSASCYHTIDRIIGSLDRLVNIILIDRTSPVGADVIRADCPECGRKNYFSWQDINVRGESRSKRGEIIEEDTSIDRLASIIYTSGTTGTAKGVMLTHKNIMSNVDSIKKTIHITTEDGLLLLLPLHHSFPFTTCMVWPLIMGATVNFVDIMSRDRTRLIMECMPTIIVGVPLLYSKIYKGIIRQVESSKLKSMLFKYGGRKIIGKALNKKLGGRLRYMISGAAPMEPDIIEGFRNLGIEFLEGYGLTETSPVAAVNKPGAAKIASVGPTLPGVEAKIIDAGPDGIGEIAIKGDNVMLGYYRNEEQTNAVLADGWFKSGDLGMIDGDGYIFITGRAKDVIVTAGGKNVYPEAVETQILKSEYIAECVVIGYRAKDSKAESVGVLISPDYDALIEHMRKTGTVVRSDIDAMNITEDEKDELVKAFSGLLESEVKKSMEKLAPFQHVTRIGIERDEFVKTSTRKIKRFLYKGRLDILGA